MANYETQIIRFGVGGLDLRKALDGIAPSRMSRLQNMVRLEDGSFTARPGQTSITNAIGTNHHSIKRLNDPQGGTWTRIWGIDTSLYYGQSGALTSAEGSFSGDPLTMVPYRNAVGGDTPSADTWMYVADRTKMRKIRTDGLDLPIGLAAPANAPTAALASELSVAIENFESGFTARTGTAGGSSVTNPAGKDSNCLQLALTAPAALPAAGTYYGFAEKSIGPIDLTTFGSGVDASDDDLLHFWLKMDRPDQIEEVHLYLVASSFTANSIPGVNSGNPDAYLKVFKGSELQGLVELSHPIDSVASQVVGQDVIDTFLQDKLDQLYENTGIQPALPVAQSAPVGAASPQTQVAGRDQWTEYGIAGRPLRRGDFVRIGSDSAATWATIRGVVVLVKVRSLTNVAVSCDHLFLRGGRGLDTSEPGSMKYDWRYSDYDPRTGAESNMSAEMTTANTLDSLRRAVTVTPSTNGDSNIRQRIYRRGGTLTDDWFFVGVNSSDGGAFTDTFSDASISASATGPTDNYQPVPTVNEAGTTVLGQAVPILFGPVEDLLFALGDPYRPGHLYYCHPGQPDHWGAGNFVEVCAPGEELMNGCVYGAQAYCFSRERMFAIYPNIAGSGTVTVTPTACTKGLVARWAMTVGGGAIWFVSTDGIYMTQGGAEVNITDETIRGLFHGETRNGLLPVDFTATTALRLEIFDGHLLFQYQDSGGTRRVLRYSTLDREWFYWTFGQQTSVLAAENNGGALTLLMGGRTSGKSYTHSGTSDDSTAIACSLRTAALDQGSPRVDKVYGDLILDLDRKSTTITAQCYINNEVSSLTAQTVTTGSGRTRYILDPFGTGPQQAQNISLDLSWSSDSQQPIAYLAGISYIGQPETIIQRPTDWDVLGTMADKYVKGVLLECDTGGLDKTVIIEGDGSTLATLTVNTSTRRVLHFAFTQGQARVIRLRSTDSNTWKLYSIQWIFDIEPLALKRYETQLIDHGIPGWQSVLWGDITIRSTADVTLNFVAYNHSGEFVDFTNYVIGSTDGVKMKTMLDFQANKGVLFKYTFTSDDDFWLYREESNLYIQPWAAEKPALVQPFGNDNLDPSRNIGNSLLQAIQAGGSLGK